MRDPKICESFGKPRASCRRGALTQLHQGVAIGRKRIPNNMLISESTASLTRKTGTPHTKFFSYILHMCLHHIVAQGVFMPSMMLCVWSFLVSLSIVSLLFLLLLFLILHVLCPTLLPQCRRRRGLIKTTALTQNEEYCSMTICILLM